MANAYRVIDEKNWERATHCAVFRNCVEPAFCVTFELDVTTFLRKVRERRFSFTLGKSRKSTSPGLWATTCFSAHPCRG